MTNAFPALWDISSKLPWQLNEGVGMLGDGQGEGSLRGVRVKAGDAKLAAPAALAHAAPMASNLMKKTGAG